MSLKKVAARMHFEAKERGVSRRVLNRGLILNLWYRENDVVLGLRRRNVTGGFVTADNHSHRKRKFQFALLPSSLVILTKAERKKTILYG